MHQVRFSVLGPVRMARADRVIPLAGPLRRGLLALLLVHAGRVVTLSEIIEALWGGAPPPTAPAQVRAGVSVIRTALRASDAAGAALPVSSYGGYLLSPGQGALDLDEFERDVAQARRARRERRPGQAHDLLQAGIDLWLGEPLADAAGAYVAGTRARLEEERRAAQEDLIDLGLELGRHVDLIPQLVGLVAANPLRQRPHGQLMVALYRTGRVAEALAVYRGLRRRLAEEQGLAPSPELDQLHVACLRGSPEMDAPAGPVTAVRPANPVQPARPDQPEAPTGSRDAATPAELPRDIGDFTGRDGVVRRMCDLLGDIGRQAPVVVSIFGKPGVGKTALAIHVAHRLRSLFPAGQLYASLGAGRRQPADPADVLAGFLRGLGVPGPTIPVRLEERAALYRSLLAERPILLVLDDVADEAQVRPLLPGQPPSAVVLTGRRRLVGLEDATVVDLGLLRPEETQDLLGSIAGVDRLLAEPAAATTIGEQCGHLPLAVRICGARLVARPEIPLSDLARRLTDEQRRLAELAAGDLDVRSSFAVSYRALPGPHRRAFRLLGLLGTPDFAPWLAAAVLGAERHDADEILQRLVDDQLLDVAGRDDADQIRYRLHDLLRLYAGERLAAEEPAGTTSAALRRAVAAATTAAEIQTGALRAGGNVAWLAAERTALVTLVEQSFQHGCTELGWRLAAALSGFFEAAFHLDDWQHTQRLALAAAVGAGDRRQEALARNRLAAVLWLADRWSEAEHHVEQCLPVLRELDDCREEARALRTLGRIQHEQGRWQQAIDSLAASCAILERLGERSELACTLRDLGMRHRFRNDASAALACLHRSMDLYEAAGEPCEAAWTRLQLGCTYRDLDKLSAAEDLLRQSMADLERFGDPSGQVQAMFQVAVTCRRQGRLQEAAGCLQTSLEGARSLGHRLGEGMILLNLGEIHADLAQYSAARRCTERSLAIFQDLGSQYWQGRAHASVGRLCAQAGRPAAAREARERALHLLQPLGAPEADEIAVLMRQGDGPDRAE